MIGNTCGGGNIVIDGYRFGVEVPALNGKIGEDFLKAAAQEDAHLLALTAALSQAGIACSTTAKLGIINFENFKEKGMIMGLIFFGSKEQGQAAANALPGEKIYDGAGTQVPPQATPKAQPKKPSGPKF